MANKSYLLVSKMLMNKKIRTFAKNKALIEERRNQIFRGAAKLFIKKGYGRTSMQELAEYLGMSKMGLYHYIGTKEDIIHLILEYSHNHERNLCKRMLENIDEHSPTEALCNAMRLYIAGVEEIQDIINFANHVTPSLPSEYRQRIYEYYTLIVDTFEKIIQRGIQSGDFRKIEANLVAQNIMLLMQAWANRRWLLRKTFTMEEYTNQQIDLIVNSIKNTAKE